MLKKIKANNVTKNELVSWFEDYIKGGWDNQTILDATETMVGYLNKKTGKNYNWKSEHTIALVACRLAEDYKFDDFKRVINIKCAEWLNDAKYSAYLRPSTLFGDKFDAYLNQNTINGEIMPDWAIDGYKEAEKISEEEKEELKKRLESL